MAKRTRVGSASASVSSPVFRREYARLLVASIWLVSLFTCGACGLFLLWDERISLEGFKALLTQVSQTYAVYVGSTVAFVYTGQSAAGSSAPGNRFGLLLASGVSLGFNLAVVGAVTGVAAGAAKLQDAITLIAFVSQYVSWLVAPVIGYYFAKPDLTHKR